MPCAKNFSPIFLSFFNIKVLYSSLKLNLPFIKSPVLQIKVPYRFSKLRFRLIKLKSPYYQDGKMWRFDHRDTSIQKHRFPSGVGGYFPKINAPKNFSPYFFRIFQNGFSLHCLRKLIFHHLSRFDFRFFEDGE